jgi:hypothetical protein
MYRFMNRDLWTLFGYSYLNLVPHGNAGKHTPGMLLFQLSTILFNDKGLQQV